MNVNWAVFVADSRNVVKIAPVLVQAGTQEDAARIVIKEAKEGLQVSRVITLETFDKEKRFKHWT